MKNSEGVGPVVVGVDGTPDALRAVVAAAHEAGARGTSLRIVHAFPRPGYRPLAQAGDPRGQSEVDTLFVEAVAAAAQAVPGLRVSTRITEGSDASVLLEESKHADLLVIGHRGLGALAGLLTGSTCVHLAGHTGCPLMIVRPTDNPDGPVVVGIDNPQRSDGLLDVAFRAAQRAGRPLVVVHSWQFPTSSGALPGYGYDVYGTAEVEAVAGEVERLRHRYLDVEVRSDVRCGAPAPTLLDSTSGASLLVVGSRGAGGLRSLVLGSVAMAATRHARCTVLVVPRELTAQVPALAATN